MRRKLAVTLLLLPCLWLHAQTGSYSATYEVTFDATWSAATHPQGFPGGAHFSPLIGASHDGTSRLWRLGELASAGIESMAEIGATSTLRSEMMQIVAAGKSLTVISGSGINSPGNTRVTFTLDHSQPLVSLVTMIAPSPDWFVGVDSLSLTADGAWIDDVTVELAPFDAGTDSGTSYNAANADTQPPVPIALIEDGPFANGAPLGTFQFRLLETAGAFPMNEAMSGLYFDPERAGEGMSVFVGPGLEGRVIAVTWYTYVNGQQLWLVGSAALADESDEAVIELFSTSGAGFGDAFQSDDVNTIPWGQLVVRFPKCDQLEARFDGADGAGTLILEPLVAPKSACEMF